MFPSLKRILNVVAFNPYGPAGVPNNPGSSPCTVGVRSLVVSPPGPHSGIDVSSGVGQDESKVGVGVAPAVRKVLASSINKTMMTIASTVSKKFRVRLSMNELSKSWNYVYQPMGRFYHFRSQRIS